jgi:hypothetical protein
MIELPKKPYKSFKDFTIHQWKIVKFSPSYTPGPNQGYPCMACRGEGRKYRREDRDPIEGYKLANKYQCEVCLGTGRKSKIQAKAEYDQEILNWKEKYDKILPKYQKQQTIIDKIRATLTPGEYRMINNIIFKQ